MIAAMELSTALTSQVSASYLNVEKSRSQLNICCHPLSVSSSKRMVATAITPSSWKSDSSAVRDCPHSWKLVENARVTPS